MAFLGQLVSQHLALAVTATTTVTFLLKILNASDWDVATALAVVAAASVPSLLLGVGVSLLPVVISLGLALAAGLMIHRWRTRTPIITWGFLAALGVLLALAYYAVPLFYLISAVILSGLVLLRDGRRADEGNGTTGKRHGEWDRMLLALAPLALLLIVLIPEPWPAERIRLANGETVVGFVIADQGHWASILRAEDRAFTRVRNVTIRSREICHWQIGPSVPLDAPIGVLLTGPRMPECQSQP